MDTSKQQINKTKSTNTGVKRIFLSRLKGIFKEFLLSEEKELTKVEKLATGLVNLKNGIETEPNVKVRGGKISWKYNSGESDTPNGVISKVIDKNQEEGIKKEMKESIKKDSLLKLYYKK